MRTAVNLGHKRSKFGLCEVCGSWAATTTLNDGSLASHRRATDTEQCPGSGKVASILSPYSSPPKRFDAVLGWSFEGHFGNYGIRPDGAPLTQKQLQDAYRRVKEHQHG